MEQLAQAIKELNKGVAVIIEGETLTASKDGKRVEFYFAADPFYGAGVIGAAWFDTQFGDEPYAGGGGTLEEHIAGIETTIDAMLEGC